MWATPKFAILACAMFAITPVASATTPGEAYRETVYAVADLYLVYVDAAGDATGTDLHEPTPWFNMTDNVTRQLRMQGDTMGRNIDHLLGGLDHP